MTKNQGVSRFCVVTFLSFSFSANPYQWRIFWVMCDPLYRLLIPYSPPPPPHKGYLHQVLILNLLYKWLLTQNASFSHWCVFKGPCGSLSCLRCFTRTVCNPKVPDLSSSLCLLLLKTSYIQQGSARFYLRLNLSTQLVKVLPWVSNLKKALCGPHDGLSQKVARWFYLYGLIEPSEAHLWLILIWKICLLTAMSNAPGILGGIDIDVV